MPLSSKKIEFEFCHPLFSKLLFEPMPFQALAFAAGEIAKLILKSDKELMNKEDIF